MQYFVSIENTSYFYWQIELLIESLLRKKLTEKLVIGIAENNDQKITGYSSNLIQYGVKFIHPNEGAEKGHKPLNRPAAIIQALQNGLLKLPFTLLHSDMVMMMPITDPKEDMSIHFETTEKTEFDLELEPLIEEIADKRGIPRKEMPEKLPFEGPIVFKSNIDIKVFQRVYQITLNLLEKFGPNFPCEKAAWTLTFYESLGQYTLAGAHLACNLLTYDPHTNFVHYTHGLPPVFNKRFYKFENLNFGSDPYRHLLDNNPTATTDFLQSIIKSYRKIK